MAAKVELLTSAEPFPSLEKEWSQLLCESACQNIFLTPEWASSWWEAFGAALQPWILLARDVPSGRLMGIAPFVLRRHPFRNGPCRELSFFGNITGAADHLDALSCVGREDVVAAAFAEFLHRHRRQWDVLRLDGMAVDSRLVALLRQHPSQSAMVWESVCPFLRLPSSPDKVLGMLDGPARQNLRRRARRLEEDTQGRVEYQRVSSPHEVVAALESLFRLHQRSRAERGQRGAFGDPAVRGFHQRLSERLLQKDRLRLYLLKANGCAIAAAYCFRYHETVSFYNTGYDSAWAKYSPGTAIIAHAIGRATEEGAREFDFLRGAEPYKSLWTQTARRNLRLRLATTTPGSVLVHTYRMARAMRDKLRKWRSGASDLNRPADNGRQHPSEAACCKGRDLCPRT